MSKCSICGADIPEERRTSLETGYGLGEEGASLTDIRAESDGLSPRSDEAEPVSIGKGKSLFFRADGDLPGFSAALDG